MERTGLSKFAGLVKGHESHKFIVHSKNPKKGNISYVAYQLTWKYIPDRRQSVKKWQKVKETYQLHYENKDTGEKFLSKPINYLIISEFIRKNGYFDHNAFGLPFWASLWLDDSNNSVFNSQIGPHLGHFSFNNAIPQQQFGDNYPIHPSIDREGHILTSIQSQLIERIVKKRETLISSSDQALTEEWVFDLMELINNTISLLDKTLIKIFIKAKYDPLPHWTVDLHKLGKKEGRRLNDKLKWVRDISGKNLDMESERTGLDTLREVRNHFNHFDPPSIVITLEEATQWLNYVIDIGMILCKIRIALDIQLPIPLLNFLLQKEAVFNPIDLGLKRTPLVSEKYGYKSSTW